MIDLPVLPDLPGYEFTRFEESDGEARIAARWRARIAAASICAIGTGERQCRGVRAWGAALRVRVGNVRVALRQLRADMLAAVHGQLAALAVNRHTHMLEADFDESVDRKINVLAARNEVRVNA